MIFHDRHSAGKQLTQALAHFKDDSEALVIALPRGGVVVGYEVARSLNLDLDIVCPRKIGAPLNDELAIGAVTESGEGVFSKDLIKSLGVSDEYIDEQVRKKQKEALDRIHRYRQNRPPQRLADKKVLLIDDGLATGSTMQAAIKTVKQAEPKSITVAVPVGSAEALQRIEKQVNNVVCLHTPRSFYAVGQFYNHFEQTEDEEVMSLLKDIAQTKS